MCSFIVANISQISKRTIVNIDEKDSYTGLDIKLATEKAIKEKVRVITYAGKLIGDCDQISQGELRSMSTLIFRTHC